MKENPGQFKRNQEIRTLIVSKDYKELSKYLSKNFEKLSIKRKKASGSDLFLFTRVQICGKYIH